ncbi:hypothetical protein B0H14DRAFT_3428779 [Mycena olivaceomarginata]|nr:hypothetical protein B0H14DRAFT_3428779 [Mycena olivaceomarginata]
MSAARETVISTPELLEATLSHLPMHDLLVSAPLVSKMWQATTLTPILQRALFFQPDPSSPRGPNPLLAKSFFPFFTSDEVWMWSARDIGAMPWANTYKAFRRRQASWRRMLVMQPPLQKVIVREIRDDSDGVRQWESCRNSASAPLPFWEKTLPPRFSAARQVLMCRRCRSPFSLLVVRALAERRPP